MENNITKSSLIKTILSNSIRSTSELASYLGYSKGYFDNKLHRNSWSFEDIVSTADYCGYHVKLVPDDIYKDVLEEIEINPENFMTDRCKKGREEDYKKKHDEYVKKKMELEELAKELRDMYGNEEVLWLTTGS